MKAKEETRKKILAEIESGKLNYKKIKDSFKKGLIRFGDLPVDLKMDREIAFIALKKGESLSEVPPDLLDDFDFAYKYFLNSHNEPWRIQYDFRFFSEKIKNDPIILLAALDEHIPHIYEWRCDDVGNIYTYNYYDKLESECFQDKEFTKIIINAFFKTPFSKDYNYDEVKENPFSIYEIMRKLHYRQDLYFLDKEPDASIGLQFKDEIARMMQERRSSRT